MSHGKSGQNFNPPRGVRMSAVAPIYEIDQAQYRRTVSRTLRLAFSNERNPIKRLAEIAGATPHAAKNWLDNRCAPGAFHLSRLRASIPELDAEIRRLEVMEANHDPAFERELATLVQTYLAKRQAQLTAEHDHLREGKDS